MVILLIRAVNWFTELILLLLLARAILSWFSMRSYGAVNSIYTAVCSITEPLVAPCRNVLMRFNTGMFDFSVVMAFFMVSIARKIIILGLLLLR